MKVTYHLSTSECTSSHSSKWRKEQPFILNHTPHVRTNMKVTYLLSQVNAQVHTAPSGEKSNHSFLITHLVFNCKPNMKVTYNLNTNECTSRHSSKWRKEQLFIVNHTSHVRPNMKVTYLLSQVNAQVHTAASEEKSNHSLLITHLMLDQI